MRAWPSEMKAAARRDIVALSVNPKIALGAAFVLVVLALTLGGPTVTSGLRASTAAANASPSWTAPGEVLVRFRAGTSGAQMAAAHDLIAAQVIQAFQIVPNLQLVR